MRKIFADELAEHLGLVDQFHSKWYSKFKYRFAGLVFVLIVAGMAHVYIAYKWTQPTTFDEKNEFLQLVSTIATGAVVISGVYLTFHSVRTSQANTRLTSLTVKNATEQLQIDRDTKIAELFYKASEQLGDKDSPQRRVAGLYSLQKLSKDHENDYYQQCIDVVIAFVQASFRAGPVIGHLPQNFVAPTDLSVAVSILCQRQHCYMDGEDEPLRFVGVDFRGVEFRDGDFCGANFIGCDFTGSKLITSRFSGCLFYDCAFYAPSWLTTDFRGTTFVRGTYTNLDVQYSVDAPRFRTEATLHARDPHNPPKGQLSYRLQREWDHTKFGRQLLENLDINLSDLQKYVDDAIFIDERTFYDWESLDQL